MNTKVRSRQLICTETTKRNESETETGISPGEAEADAGDRSVPETTKKVRDLRIWSKLKNIQNPQNLRVVQSSEAQEVTGYQARRKARVRFRVQWKPLNCLKP